MGTWRSLWSGESAQINQCLSQWRQTGKADLKLVWLSQKSDRQDSYDFVIVTFNQPASKVSGKRHLAELQSVVAPMLGLGESVKVAIVKRNNADYLEFS